ncbi:unnamed protein product [Mytilus edulis]|uniref:C2H2-type domain-containing protein n=1 Tax=Mytilus edulis TaxID=6550 RepID=A0A8S3S670_MYTED|nr:unnamed protein product [Mytilus edulis]
MQTIIHVFDNASQDARTSNAVLRNTLQQFQQMNPSLKKKAYIRSDNAGCFHGFLAVSEIALINEEENIKVVQMDFADPQGGKSICDRRAAHIKSAIRKYVNEGHDVCTAADFKKALQICSLRNVAVVVALPPESSNKKEIKSQIQNITTLNNFAYQQTGIRVFRQYGIGEGKFLTNSSLKLQLLSCSNITVVEAFAGHLSSIPSRTARQGVIVQDCRNETCNIAVDQSDVDIEEEVDDIGSNLFTCSEPNCLSTFSKYGNLVRHLNVGSHRTKPMVSSLIDKSKIQYASKIEQKLVVLPSCCHETTERENSCKLCEGWGLKQRRTCDPEEVSLEMRSKKKQPWKKRFFSKDEFLSATQIASYFSRLVLEKRKTACNSYDEEDMEAGIAAETLEELQVLARN